MAFTNPVQFYEAGREPITRLAQAVTDLAEVAAVFEIRGGELAMNAYNDMLPGNVPVGTATVQYVMFYNALRDFLDANNGQWRAVLNQYRNDY